MDDHQHDEHDEIVSVAVVNDYPLVAAGLASLLAPYVARVRVREYVDTTPAPDEADVVLFDLFGHPHAQERLRQLTVATRAPVILFGWGSAEAGAELVRRVGAVGFVSKTLDGARILRAVEEAARGGHPGARGDADAANDADDAAGDDDLGPMCSWPGRDDGLTQRESEIVCLITAGLSNVEIAARLFLSVNSVKTYIRTAYRTMGVTRRPHAVLWGIDHGLRPRRPDG